MFKDINWWTVGLWVLIGYTIGMAYFHFDSGLVYSLIDGLTIWAVAMIGRFEALRQLQIDFGVE